jgi:membrane protease YdiL (CAAX protease family)
MEARYRGAAQQAIRKGKCPWCGYSIAGLPGTTCPECGNDWSTWVAKPDPGSPRLARIGIILAAILIIAVAVLQQTTESAAARAAGQPPTAHPMQALKAPSAQFEITAKIMTRIAASEKDTATSRMLVQSLDGEARTDADRFRMAIVAGDLLGEDEGQKRLAKIEERLAEDSPLSEDIQTVRALYAGNADPAKVQELEQRHGWFGKLASTYGLPMADEDRRAVAGGGGKIMTAVSAAIIAGLVLLFTSLALFILAIVLAASGKLKARFLPPAPGGSVAIEMVVVFVTSFIGLKLVTGLVESVSQSSLVAVIFAMTVQWSLMAVLLWPVVRGVPAREALALWGLYRGEGIFKEIGCGVVGYLALLPLLVAGAALSFALMVMYQAIRAAVGMPEPTVPENPIIDILSGGTPVWVVGLLALLASLWAPLVEESVFRGALYRQLRSRWHWFPAGVVTALGFGLMHGYPLLLLGPVIALGFGFALLREWRGSIIASMTAHCLHNTTVITLLLLAMKFIGT